MSHPMQLDSSSYESIQAKESDYLFVAPSQIPHAGNGLFTAIRIWKGEIISLFKGEKLSNQEAANRAEKREDAYFICLLDGSILDSMHIPCFAKYANDTEGISKTTFKHNAIISLDEKERVCLVAIRNIKAGEEIFCSYGKKYWKQVINHAN